MKILFCILFFISSSTLGSELKFLSDFETGAIQSSSESHDGWSRQGSHGGQSIVTDRVRHGTKALKFTLNQTDWIPKLEGETKPRTQLMKPYHALQIIPNREYWIGYSTFIPSDWKDEEATWNNETLFQVLPPWGIAAGQAKLSMSIWGSEMTLTTRSGKWQTETWQNRARTIQTYLDKGVWVDWVIRVKFTYDNTGYVELYKNRKKIISDTNIPTMFYSDAPDWNLKMFTTISIYKPKFRSSGIKTRTMYFDEFKFYEGANGLSMVSPPGPVGPAPPIISAPKGVRVD